MILNIERGGHSEEMQEFIDWLEFTALRSSKNHRGHSIYDLPEVNAIAFNPFRFMSMGDEQFTVKCDSVTYDGHDFTLAFRTARLYMVVTCSQ